MGHIELIDVHYSYPNSTAEVIRGISFELKAAEELLIVGPNLSGKTSLATVMLRAHLKQLEGVLAGRFNISFHNPLKSLLGFTFEDPNWMFCNLRVEDEVAFGLENLGVDPKEIRRKVDEGLECVGLAGFHDRQISTLSGGEMQKLAIAAAVATEPEIIITDDLLSNLDVSSVPQLSAMLHDRKLTSGSIWIDLSRRWRDNWSRTRKLAILSEGKFVALGPTEATVADLWSRGELCRCCELPEEIQILARANRELLSRHMKPIPPLIERDQIVAAVSRLFRVRNPGNQTGQPRKGDASNKLALVADKLNFSYVRGAMVLRDCTFEASAGKVNVLAGRNGSGKSTLAKLLTGFLKPTSGSIFYSGRSAGQPLLRQKVSLVLQNPEYHFLTDSVSEEIRLAVQLLPLPSDALEGKMEDVTVELDLESKLSVSPFALTAGEKRRLAVGLALLRKPEILIIDEPTLGQDYKQSRLLGSVFSRLASEGTTVILISHDARFILEYGDVIHLLDRGSISYSGSVPDLFLPSSASDFASQSAITNIWYSIGALSSPGVHPRSLEELFSIISPTAYEH